jgi:hypothetical protein
MKGSFFYPPADKVSRIAMVYVQRDEKLVRAPESILGGDPAKYRKSASPRRPGDFIQQRRICCICIA